MHFGPSILRAEPLDWATGQWVQRLHWFHRTQPAWESPEPQCPHPQLMHNNCKRKPESKPKRVSGCNKVRQVLRMPTKSLVSRVFGGHTILNNNCNCKVSLTWVHQSIISLATETPIQIQIQVQRQTQPQIQVYVDIDIDIDTAADGWKPKRRRRNRQRNIHWRKKRRVPDKSQETRVVRKTYRLIIRAEILTFLFQFSNKRHAKLPRQVTFWLSDWQQDAAKKGSRRGRRPGSQPGSKCLPTAVATICIPGPADLAGWIPEWKSLWKKVSRYPRQRSAIRDPPSAIRDSRSAAGYCRTPNPARNSSPGEISNAQQCQLKSTLIVYALHKSICPGSGKLVRNNICIVRIYIW